MRIACPQCGAAYELPPERLPPGRTVRCARCAVQWTPNPTPPPEPSPTVDPTAETPAPTIAPLFVEAAPPAIENPIPAVMAAQPPAPAAPVPPPRRTALAAAWAATAVILALLAWLAVTRRADLIRAWPPSERAYAALNLVPASH